jgi:ethanolamine utilization microcompartment shell protein EutS
VHITSATDTTTCGDIDNTATVTISNGDGASDDASILVICPAIDIVKTVNPVSGNPGDTVTYTYLVTNTGDTTLYNISVDDDVIGHIGDIAELAAGDSVTLTKDWVLPANEVLVTNVGTATGTDVLGKTVSANDDASVTIVEANNPPKPPGSDVQRFGLVALALLALGFLALAFGRRRGRHEAA